MTIIKYLKVTHLPLMTTQIVQPIQPAFGWAQHLKSGQNTQQLLPWCRKIWDIKVCVGSFKPGRDIPGANPIMLLHLRDVYKLLLE